MQPSTPIRHYINKHNTEPRAQGRGGSPVLPIGSTVLRISLLTNTVTMTNIWDGDKHTSKEKCEAGWQAGGAVSKVRTAAANVILSIATLTTNYGLVCQKQVSRAGTSNYIPQYLWDVITCPCPWYFILVHKSSIKAKVKSANALPPFMGRIQG